MNYKIKYIKYKYINLKQGGSFNNISKQHKSQKNIPSSLNITINLVAFYSEGPPNDNGLNLSENKQIILQQIKHFNNISVYTPKILKNMGLDKYVMEYKTTGLVTHNRGMSKIGFSAWRPKIMLLELILLEPFLPQKILITILNIFFTQQKFNG